MKIVFLDTETFGEAFQLAQFQPYGEIISYGFTSAEDTAQRIASANVVVTNKVSLDQSLLEQNSQLSLICVAATGTDHVDVAFAEANGILVKNAVDYSTESVAEITLSLILALKNQIKYYDRYVSSGDYEQSNTFTHIGPGFGLMKNMTVGIVGLGNIGKKVAQVCQCLGAKVIYYSISGIRQEVDYTFYNDLHEFLAASDVVSLHCPLSEKSRGLLGQQEFRTMKSSALLVNLARGAVVVESDLIEALETREIAGAALDVFEKEPVPASSPMAKLYNLPNVILTPHIAWASIEARKKLLSIIEQHVKHFI